MSATNSTIAIKAEVKKAGKKAEFHQSGRNRIDDGQIFQGVIYRQQFIGGHAPLDSRFQKFLGCVQAGRLPDLSPTRPVDKDPPHRLSGDSEEVCPVVIVDRPTSEDADAQLVHQGIRLQCMIAPLAL